VVIQDPPPDVVPWNPGFPIRGQGAGGWPNIIIDMGDGIGNLVLPDIIIPASPPPQPPLPVVTMWEAPELDFGENFGWSPFRGGRSGRGRGRDPLAQTFTVSGMPGGIFITDIDVYFKTKPETGANGEILCI
jgi:hypothetical protein